MFTATPAMARLGMPIEMAETPEMVAREGLENITNGPVWIVSTRGNVERARMNSGIDAGLDLELRDVLKALKCRAAAIYADWAHGAVHEIARRQRVADAHLRSIPPAPTGRHGAPTRQPPAAGGYSHPGAGGGHC